MPVHPPKLSLVRWTFLSKYLGRQQEVNILLPGGCFSNCSEGASRPYKVLWLLHGKGDDYNSWLRNSIVENLARKYQIAIIMPDGGNSFYCNMVNGPEYYSYICEELPELLPAFLPLSTSRNDQFIAGLSMGGYGALKIALRQPERFSAVGSFSGVLNISDRFKKGTVLPFEQGQNSDQILEGHDLEAIRFQKKQDLNILINAFGSNPDFKTNHEDIFQLLDNLKADKVPSIFLSCGRQDPLFQDSLQFEKKLQGKGISCKSNWMEGDHSWDVWNLSILYFFSFLNEKGLIQ